MPIDLFLTVRASRAELIEDAVVAIETLGVQGAFNINDIVGVTQRSPRRFGAARQALKVLEQTGLIDRVSPPQARPTRYRIHPS
jgi:hypothetical protein